jgi:MOSC domain-containing protein YiiM
MEDQVAQIFKLFRAPKRRAPMEELAEASLLTNSGVENCAHARPNGQRQVLLMDRETLLALRLNPGIVRENITTAGLDVNGLQIGEQLRVGAVRLQVSAVCEPCEQLEEVRPGLTAEMQGRRGMLCRVIEGGVVRPGDFIEKLEALELQKQKAPNATATASA